jgi:hypothetical protein
MLSEYVQRTELFHSKVEQNVDVLEVFTVNPVVLYSLKMDQ